MSAVFVGLKGFVVAIDRTTGDTLWSARLRGSDFVTVTVDDGAVFATTRGRLYRLDPATGDIMWSNTLPGLGYGIASIAGSSSGPAAERRRREQAAAAGA
ncbi:MAG TPA: PQQ-binding-like beta-propeller repeat protein [Vicinamibacterales bacterium]|nr:PQQ-binding-like beta-propeller repeat protein [Vicinamibacterales bacterium]